jgi:death on curing protein
VRDLDALRAAVRPWGSSLGRDHFPTPFDKAAALAESIIRRHPFIEGNKRTATFAAAYLLETSGHELEVEQQDLEEDLAVGVAEGGMDTTDIARWFEYHSRRT